MTDSRDDRTPAYEPPDAERAASASPTESELEREAVTAAPDPYAAFRHPAYAFFSIGWLFSVMGSLMTQTAFSWEVYERTRSSLAVGWAFGIQAIPLIFLALPAGALADRLDRRSIIRVTAVLASICSAGLAYLSFRPGSLGLMYGVLLVLACVNMIGRPARAALVPQVVPPSVLANAMTWNASIFQVAAMVGPALGGLVIAFSFERRHSVSLAYALDSLCALVFCLMLLLMPRKLATQSWTRRAEGGRISELLAGIRFVRDNPIILATITLDLFAVLFGGAVALLPTFCKEILHVDQVGYGWLRAAEAIGAFMMALIMAHRPPMKRAGRAMLLAVAAFGLFTIIFGLSRWFWLSFLMVALIGAVDNISVVVRHTLVQVLTPESMRGRVSAVNSIFIGCSNELGGLESGLTAQAFGPIASVVGGGMATIAVVAAVARRWPVVRRLGSLSDPMGGMNAASQVSAKV